MAKVNRFILEYKESVKAAGLTPKGDMKLPGFIMKRFIRLLGCVTDERKDAMVDYPLAEVLLIAFLAILADASSWTQIAAFGAHKQKWLKKFLPLRHGIPSHDTFRRVFSLIDSDTLQQATVNFLAANIDAIRRSLKLGTGPRQICVDGKEENGTGRKYGTSEAQKNLQTLHVYDASNSICLYSEPIGSKTNEIPVAQKILKAMDLKDAIVSFDALHTQKETIRIISGQKGDYVGGLKGNQGGLLEAVASVFSEKTRKSIREKAGGFYETTEKSHNQVEKRSFYLASAKCGKDDWEKLKSFVCYEKYTCNVITKKEATETRYYITSLKDVELAADVIRGHWEVENKLHWHLDYSFHEDENTTTDKNAFQNFSLINKMVLSLCKIMQPLLKGYSIRTIRKAFAWNFEENMALLLNTFDDNTIMTAIENTKKGKK